MKKRIEAHTNAELDAAIKTATDKFGDDFYILLHGIDAYMVRRKRRIEAREYASFKAMCEEIMSEDSWGDS